MAVFLLTILSLCWLQTVILADDSCPGLPKCFCNKDKTSVNCDGQHFTTVPATIPTTVVKLFLRYNHITNVTANAFAGLVKLERLWLNQNKLMELQPFAFGNLSSLTYLDLRNNKLVDIPKNALSGMERLDVLFLTTNAIQTIHEKAFDGTAKLTYISLQSNALTSVPALGYMPNLQRLVLEGNAVTDATFPESFKASKQLEYIGLSNNKIQRLKNETFKALTNNSLSSLYLSRNSISFVEPGTFSRLSAIQSLKLGSNPIDGATLKTALTGLMGKAMASLDISALKLNDILLQDTFALLKNTSITTLNMGANKIETIHNNTFSGLNYLLHLDISNCEIQTTFGNSFSGLDKLSILNLERNRLTQVPQNFPSMLTHLFLDNNQITNIPANAFINLGSLQELRIRFNKINKLSGDSFLGLQQLNKLNLYYNYLNPLPGEIFKSLTRLVSLNLAKNNIITIQTSTTPRFSSLTSLQYLNLADNKCTFIQSDTFKDTLSLRYLHLENNSLGKLLAEDFGGTMFQSLGNLKELSLMNNGISSFPEPSFKNLGSLQYLNVSNNKMSTWGSHLFSSTGQLTTLDLSNNLITTIKEDNMKPLGALKTLNLTGNPFACNCDLRWFRDWVDTTSVFIANSSAYMCNGPKDWAGKPFLTFSRNKINCMFFLWYQIVIACAVVVVIVIIIAIVMYRKRWYLKLFIYKRTRGHKRRRKAADGGHNYGAIDDNQQMTYDAYISCAEEDKDWARDNLLEGIDRGQLNDNHKFGGRFSMYFEDRDAEPGKLSIML